MNHFSNVACLKQANTAQRRCTDLYTLLNLLLKNSPRSHIKNPIYGHVVLIILQFFIIYFKSFLNAIEYIYFYSIKPAINGAPGIFVNGRKGLPAPFQFEVHKNRVQIPLLEQYLSFDQNKIIKFCCTCYYMQVNYEVQIFCSLYTGTLTCM